MPATVNRIVSSYEVFLDEDLECPLFEGREEEFDGYLRESVPRFCHILKLFGGVVHDGKVKVLEIGADPFALTTCLKNVWGDLIDLRGIAGIGHREVWPGAVTEINQRSYYIWSPSGVFEFPAWELNVERDTFPYEDNTFDIALLTWVIEMLMHSPTHTLTEIHRVLRPGGQLILNTPNALKIQRLFKHMLNISPEFPYSGYGPYGRPNRLFTLKELAQLLSGCGFRIREAELLTPPRKYSDRRKELAFSLVRALTLLPAPYLVNKRDQIFIVAESVGERSLFYPEALYISRHA